MQAKNERSFSTEKPIDSTNSNGALSPYFEIVNGSENKQEKLCYPQNYKDNEEAKFRTIKTITTTDDSKKNIMEVASYKLENLNYQAAACNVKANINNPDSNSPNNKASCTRYINPITNNIHSIEDIELLEKKSKNIKLLKPFTPYKITNILVNQVNYQTQNKSDLKNNKNHINNNQEEKEIDSILRSEKEAKYLKNNLKSLSRINTIKTDNVSYYYKETCPTEVTYVNTVCSREKSNLDPSSRIDKILKIKKLEEKINQGKIKKLEKLKSQISVGFGKMVGLEENIRNRISDDTLDFRNKLDILQEKHYSTYKNQWHHAKPLDNL